MKNRIGFFFLPFLLVWAIWLWLSGLNSSKCFLVATVCAAYNCPVVAVDKGEASGVGTR